MEQEFTELSDAGAGFVVASLSVTQEVAGWQVQALLL